MFVSELPFASVHLLRRIEELGLAGTWKWNFETGEQGWSAGFYRLLGLEPYLVRPSYGLFLDFVHPNDRPRLRSAAEMRQGAPQREQVFRVVRPDGTTRTLSASHEARLSAEGRPRSASGTVLDVSDRAHLGRMLAAERQRRIALAHQANISVYCHRTGEPSELADQYTGIFRPSLEDFLGDPYLIVAPEHRSAARESVARYRGDHSIGRAQRLFQMAAGGDEWRNVLDVPIHDDAGEVVARTGIIYPMRGPLPLPGDLARQGLEQAVRGRHLRAARALLDWPMTQLAEASGLSLSTVRRLEEDAQGPADRSRHRAVAALRAAGIRFVLLDDGTLAVARG